MTDVIKINKVDQITDFKWLNLFRADCQINGKSIEWIYASRKTATTKENKPDAVIIVPFLKIENNLKIVLIEQYRIPIESWEISFPAGLIDKGETIEDAARRELKEETGLDIHFVKEVSPAVISSAGISDESISFVFCDVSGKISNKGNEDSENIIVKLVDIKDLSSILKEDIVLGKKVCSKTWAILWGLQLYIDMIEISKNL